jgi:hypothetical protein
MHTIPYPSQHFGGYFFIRIPALDDRTSLPWNTFLVKKKMEILGKKEGWAEKASTPRHFFLYFIFRWYSHYL